MLICTSEECTCYYHELLDCIQKGTNDEAKAILQTVENVCDLADNSGLTLMHYGSKSGNAVMLQYFISKGCKINAQDSSGVSSLWLSVENKHLATVEILLKNNADIFLTDHNGVSSLEKAIRNRLDTEDNENSEQLIVDVILDKIRKNLSTDKDRTARLLLNAHNFVKYGIAVFGDVQLVNFILENGYNTEFYHFHFPYRHTALASSIFFKRLKNAKILIERGAKIDESALWLYRLKCEDIDEQCEFLEYLLKCTMSDVSLEDRTRREDVRKLLRWGNRRTVNAVLKFGIDVCGRFCTGQYLVHLLAGNENAGVIDLFHELNIPFDVNQLDSDGKAAILDAAISGGFKNVEFILKNGGDVNAVFSVGHTALTFALTKRPRTAEQEKNSAKIAELLLQRGVNAQYSSVECIVTYISRDKRLPWKVVLAHMAMLGSLKNSPLTDFTRNKIKIYPTFEAYFNSCMQQLEKMKKIEVQGTVTLFKLLTEPDEKIVAYARNLELELAFKNAVDSINLESYYSNTLHNRIARSISQVKLDRKAAVIFQELTELNSSIYHNIVDQIFRYLSFQDLLSLCKVKSN